MTLMFSLHLSLARGISGNGELCFENSENVIQEGKHERILLACRVSAICYSRGECNRSFLSFRLHSEMEPTGLESKISWFQLIAPTCSSPHRINRSFLTRSSVLLMWKVFLPASIEMSSFLARRRPLPSIIER